AALAVEQAGLGRLEDPFVALALGFAGVNLNAVSHRFEELGRAIRGRHRRFGGVRHRAQSPPGPPRPGGRAHAAPFPAPPTTSTSTSMAGSARPAMTSRVEAG